MGCDDPEPETEEGIGDPVEGSLAAPLGLAEGQLADDEAELGEPYQRAGQRGRGLPDSARDLGDSVSASPDDVQKRPQRNGGGPLLCEEPIGLEVKRAERVEDELVQRFLQIGSEGLGQLPVSRDATPCCERPDGTEGGAEGEALHHVLGGAGDGHEEVSAFRLVIEPALEDAGERGAGLDEVRQLVQDERPPPECSRRFAGQRAQQRPPVRVGGVWGLVYVLHSAGAQSFAAAAVMSAW